MTYKEWLHDWLELYVKTRVKEQTHKRYEIYIRCHIVPLLGDIKLSDLDANIVQKAIVFMTNKCTVHNKKIATGTVIGIFSVLKASLQAAAKHSLIDLTIVNNLCKPKRVEKQIKCFSIAEQKLIEKYILCKEKRRYLGILLCFYTGMRIGELMALRWEDVDLKNRLLNINKNCYDIYKNGARKKIITTTKTPQSSRIIPIPYQIVEYLKRWQKEKDAFLVADNNKDIAIRSYQRTFELILKKLKIPHRGFHSIRHTFATRALECGMDVKTLAEILGHKNSTITLDRYVHSMTEHKIEMMKRVGKFFE